MQLSIGKNIQNRRKAMGMTQEQLATVTFGIGTKCF